jgi:hypothetical protein
MQIWREIASPLGIHGANQGLRGILICFLQAGQRPDLPAYFAGIFTLLLHWQTKRINCSGGSSIRIFRSSAG